MGQFQGGGLCECIVRFCLVQGHLRIVPAWHPHRTWASCQAVVQLTASLSDKPAVEGAKWSLRQGLLPLSHAEQTCRTKSSLFFIIHPGMEGRARHELRPRADLSPLKAFLIQCIHPANLILFEPGNDHP